MTLLYQSPKSVVNAYDDTVVKTYSLPSEKLSRWLASRNFKALQLLKDLPGIPQPLGLDGRSVFMTRLNIAQLLYRIPENSLPSSFFEELFLLLEDCRECGVQPLDLSRRNIGIDPEGKPLLFDWDAAYFQGHGDSLWLPDFIESMQKETLQCRADQFCDESLVLRDSSLLAPSLHSTWKKTRTLRHHLMNVLK